MSRKIILCALLILFASGDIANGKVRKSAKRTAKTTTVVQNHEEEIENFCMEHGIDEQAFCTIDPVTLKTVVRANPGVFVVQNGTIIDKYNMKDY